MSIKLAILENKEQVIADVKELVDDNKPVGYIFNRPHRVYTEQKFLSENSDFFDTIGAKAIQGKAYLPGKDEENE